VAITFLAIVVVLVGAGAVGVYLYSDKAKPGVSIAGQDVSGQDGQQLLGVVNSLVSSFKVTLTNQGGQSVTATPTDLGISFDPAATVQQAISGAPGANPLTLYNPWEPKSVPLVYTVDEATAQAYLDQNLIPASGAAKDASVSYDTKAAKFVVTPGVIGQAANLDDLKTALTDAVAGGSAASYSVSSVPTPPEVSDDMANQAATQANNALKLALKFKSTRGTYQVPATSIAAWTSFTPTDGALGVTYDETAITKELPAALGKALVVAPVDETYLTTPSGSRIARASSGVNGTVLTAAAKTKAVSSTLAALTAGKALTQTVQTKAAAYKTVDQVVPHDYGSANGSKWIEVDLTHQRATLYRGTTKVTTYVIASGRRPLVTHAGTWYVWYKTPMQDMKGLNPDGSKYVAKDVRWISFFHNGEGFHAAPWVSNFGTPHSHGCINMRTGEAKELYDWAPLGTMVKVVGVTP